ncbi:MAG: ATP-dependent RecD-like DNA helicase [Deltaproteobacteria bacterium]|nr:ATP-dependent RecD-like DNA helicase [Deltaproteobacteria bacterium]
MPSGKFSDPSEETSRPLATLEGVVERLTFSNPENQYAVLQLAVKGRRQTVTVVGPLAAAREGEELRLKGSYEVHPRYGEQFKAVWWYAVLPATVAGIQKYLASGLIKGIGPELARRLVEHFGPDTLSIVDEAPERLTEVPGIGAKRLKQIIRDWQSQREAREILVGLQGLGLSMAFATRVYKHYGDRSLEVATGNPYQLALDVQGVGFQTADRLAARLNLDPLAPTRLAAGLLHVIDEMSADGHVYVPRDLLLERTQELLKVPSQPLAGAVNLLAREGRVVLQDLPGGPGVYKKPAWVAETGVAQSLGRLKTSPGAPAPLHLTDVLADVERRRAIELSPEQRDAVAGACREKLHIITGGPGTGKTTIISCILDLFRRLGSRVLLMAPTGRAAKRLSEATGADATTIHRALEFSPQNGGFKRHAGEPLKADVVIVDEVSMVDTYLMYHLLRAVPPSARLVLVGDVNQLPAVGPGNILKDLIDSTVVPVKRLTQIYRQARESLIVVNAHRINQGAFPVLARKFGDRDFVFQELEEPDAVHRRLLWLVADLLPKTFGFDPVRDIQVITPMHKGRLGVASLNHDLQRRLNDRSPAYTWGDRHLKRGDKVMQLKNNYLKDVFNGDIGRVWGYNGDTGQLTVNFEGRLVNYESGERDEITLAYAVTVHKAQGSEFPAVVLVLTTQHYMLLQRNLLYTALTRGRQLVVLLGSKKALGMAIRNDRPVRRYTDLKNKLQAVILPEKR